ncbi:MAG: hypothetical protein HY360_22885 [Verrucomicrobia bacterium]|nr:hypothetical protein [Verrucomicrobiota bacterium]
MLSQKDGRWLQAILCAAWIAVLMCGCGLSEKIKARKQQDETRQRIKAKSDQIWEESSAKQAKTRDLGPGGGTLRVGDKEIVLTQLSLLLGSAKPENAANETSVTSELKGSAANGVSFSIRGFPVEAEAGARQIAGQSINLTADTAANTEITSADGAKWRLVDGLIQFTRVERNAVFLSVEAVAASAGDESSEKLKVTGELQARIGGAWKPPAAPPAPPTTPPVP